MFNRIGKLTGKLKAQLSEEDKHEGEVKRQKILSRAESARKLSRNADFQTFLTVLREDKQGLLDTLLNETTNNILNAEVKVRLIARINQIDRIINKPKSLIWQMENLTPVREALQEKTRERQALGKKTGGV